jgi:hypothetical protein
MSPDSIDGRSLEESDAETGNRMVVARVWEEEELRVGI